MYGPNGGEPTRTHRRARRRPRRQRRRRARVVRRIHRRRDDGRTRLLLLWLVAFVHGPHRLAVRGGCCRRPARREGGDAVDGGGAARGGALGSQQRGIHPPQHGVQQPSTQHGEARQLALQLGRVREGGGGTAVLARGTATSQEMHVGPLRLRPRVHPQHVPAAATAVHVRGGRTMHLGHRSPRVALRKREARRRRA